MTPLIFVTGGVVSSLGKGIAAASLAAILEARGLRVTMMKLDPYINVDPGTMSPFQHGEVYVTDDGAETDLDLGHYERFVRTRLTGALTNVHRSGGGVGRSHRGPREHAFRRAESDLHGYLAASRRPPAVGGTKNRFERIAFFVNWDDNSLVSLRHNLPDIDTLVPEWLHLMDAGGTIREDDPSRTASVEARSVSFPPMMRSAMPLKMFPATRATVPSYFRTVASLIDSLMAASLFQRSPARSPAPDWRPRTLR